MPARKYQHSKVNSKAEGREIENRSSTIVSDETQVLPI